MDNYITIRLCDEDRARLDRIAALLEAQSKNEATAAEPSAAPQTVETQANTPAKAEQPAEAKPEAQTEPKEEQPTVELAEIQRLVVALATSGKKDQARDVVKAYAERVTEIPEDKRYEAYTKLKALEA